MFSIHIKLLSVRVQVYYGSKDWPAFKHDSIHSGHTIDDEMGPDTKLSHNGLCSGSLIWNEHPDDAITWMHEALHATQNILSHIGITDNEMEAHIQDFIVGEIVRKLKARNIILRFRT